MDYFGLIQDSQGIIRMATRPTEIGGGWSPSCGLPPPVGRPPCIAPLPSIGCVAPPPSPMRGPALVVLDVFAKFRNRETDKKTEFSYKMPLGNDLIESSWLELRRTIREIDGTKKSVQKLKKEYKLLKLIPE